MVLEKFIKLEAEYKAMEKRAKEAEKSFIKPSDD